MLRACQRAKAGRFAALDLRALHPVGRQLAQGSRLMAQETFVASLKPHES